MRDFLRGLFIALSVAIALPAFAQQRGVWLQVEARPGLASAQEAASSYARAIRDVNGFRLGGTNWYAVVLGPFTADEATAQRRALRAAGLIPGDAFVTDGTAFRDRFWPIGAAGLASPEPARPQDAPIEAARPTERSFPDTEAAPLADAAEPSGPLPVPDETRREALRSERTLTPADREKLQEALKWADFYGSAIDGAFGRGTRGAMSDWQEANGYEPTGVLTTLQRAALIRDYDAVLDGLGLRMVRDAEAGVSIRMPTARVTFARHAPPFADYEPKDEGDAARVLLISQRGDRKTLAGLYDIMQTLEVVPAEGARQKRPQSFTLEGRGDEIVSHTEARLKDGQIKGFTLIWPAGDEKRRTRLLDEMRASFATDPGAVLDDEIGAPGEDQRVDLLAGLRIRRPELVRSGFYVSRRGQVLTTADAALGCGRVTLDSDIEARVLAMDETLGLALLDPTEPLAPRAHATFQARVPRLQSKAVLAGFSYGGMLGGPSLTYGNLADMRGLDGDDAVKRFALAARPGDAGGPVFDATGAVLGMMLPAPGGETRSLPGDVTIAADVESVAEFLSANGLDARAVEGGAPLPRAELEARASDMTVLVGCWK